MSAQSPTLRALRVAFGVVALAYLFGPPFIWQIVGYHEVKALPRWRMFSGHAIDLCEVRFTTGEGEPLDRLEAIGISDPSTAGTSVWRLEGFERVYKQGKRICRRKEHEDVRMHTRCAVRDGWRTVSRGKVNICWSSLEEAAEGRVPKKPYRKAKKPKEEPAPTEQSTAPAKPAAADRAAPVVTPPAEGSP